MIRQKNESIILNLILDCMIVFWRSRWGSGWERDEHNSVTKAVWLLLQLTNSRPNQQEIVETLLDGNSLYDKDASHKRLELSFHFRGGPTDGFGTFEGEGFLGTQRIIHQEFINLSRLQERHVEIGDLLGKDIVGHAGGTLEIASWWKQWRNSGQDRLGRWWWRTPRLQ